MAPRKRVRRRGSIVRMPGPGDRWRVRVRGHVPDGRPYDLDTVVVGEGEARRVLAGFLRRAMDLESGLAPLEETITLAAWCERARRGTGSGHRLSWSPRDQSVWKNHLRSLWALPLQALDADRLRGWMAGLERKELKGNTRSGAWILLRRILGAALDSRVLVRLPWGEARLALVPGSDCARGAELEPHEWEALRDAAARIDAAGGGGALHDLWLRVSLQRVVGARPVELCQVGPADIVPGPHGALLRISSSVAAKGGAPGLKRMGDELASALLAHVELQPEAARRLDLLFPMRAASRGVRWCPRWVRDAKGYLAGRHWIASEETTALRLESGLPSFVPYQLRHTCLTEVAHTGGSVAAQTQGGHRNLRTTQRYVHGAARHFEAPLFAELSSLITPSAPIDPSIGGRPTGAGPSDEDLADARSYAAHVLSHGAPDTARALIRTLGPLDAYGLSRDLAMVTLSPELVDVRQSLVGLVAQLRAQAILASPQKWAPDSQNINDVHGEGEKNASCFTGIELPSPDRG